MNEISNINDITLLRRLEEIEGEFQDFHISAYKSDLLIKERDVIKYELRKRGYKV